jgi:hypothetical protein
MSDLPYIRFVLEPERNVIVPMPEQRTVSRVAT